MKPKALIALFIVVFAAALAACDAADPTPAGPTRDQPAQTRDQPAGQPPAGGSQDPAFHVADVTVSGIVFEITPAGRRPVEGVDVLNGEGSYATTDANGFYNLRPVWVCPCAAQPWVRTGMTFLWVAKDGYTDPSGTPASVFGRAAGASGARDVAVDGDTRFDIELVRR